MMDMHKTNKRLDGPFKIDVTRPMPICKKCQDQMFLALNVVQDLVNYEVMLYSAELDQVGRENMINNMRAQLNTTINMIEKAYANKCGKLPEYLHDKYDIKYN